MLSDLVMPQMGGMALCRALRWWHSVVKVVVLTGYPSEEEIESLLSERVVDWLQKLLSLEQLARAVTRVLKEG